MCGNKTGNAMCFQIVKSYASNSLSKCKKNMVLMKNLDGKEVRYDERVFGRDENDQGNGVASEGFF